ncbi:MAG: hypothetical protein JNK64_20620 [Myxococcales bacterium]|nr:hypothetical protein [Myxococcales bacterium]
MRAVALALVLSTLATTGCATRSTSGVAIGLGVVTAVTGVAIASGDGPEPASPDDPYGSFDPDFRPVGRAIALAGAALIAVGVVSLVQIGDEEPEAEAAAPPPMVDVSLDRDTLAAYEYARRGDCAAVAAIAAGVRRSDPWYYREQFASDPLLAPCLR